MNNTLKALGIAMLFVVLVVYVGSVFVTCLWHHVIPPSSTVLVAVILALLCYIATRE